MLKILHVQDIQEERVPRRVAHVMIGFKNPTGRAVGGLRAFGRTVRVQCGRRNYARLTATSDVYRCSIILREVVCSQLHVTTNVTKDNESSFA